jgi:micrococcal nuclease
LNPLKKQWSFLILSSAIILSGCSSGVPNAANDAEFDRKLNNITGNPLETDSESTQSKKHVIENVKTVFWPAQPQFKMRAAKVTDVNPDLTIEVNGNEKVRLLGIRTTEENKRTRKYHGMVPKQAAAYTKKNLLNQQVYLEVNPAAQMNQKGETLAYIWIGNDKKLNNFNAVLLREGLAVTERQVGITVYDEAFKKIENEAIQKKKGLWRTAE